MKYTTKQIDKAADWFADQAQDDPTMDTIAVEFETLKAIVVDKKDPNEMFDYLMDWAEENIDNEEVE